MFQQLIILYKFKILEPYFNNINILDCKYNYIFDTNINYIKEAIDLLPSCHTINLSNNCLYGRDNFDEIFCEILNKPQIKIVNICNNLVATISRTDFYKKLD